jgi:hypothetical protein
MKTGWKLLYRVKDWLIYHPLTQPVAALTNPVKTLRTE